MDGSRGVGHLLVEWRGHQSTSGPGFWLDGGIPSAGVRRNGCWTPPPFFGGADNNIRRISSHQIHNLFLTAQSTKIGYISANQSFFHHYPMAHFYHIPWSGRSFTTCPLLMSHPIHKSSFSNPTRTHYSKIENMHLPSHSFDTDCVD